MKTREAVETSYWHTTSFLRGLPWRTRILMSKVASVPARAAHAISRAGAGVKSRDGKATRRQGYVDLSEVRKFSMLDLNVLRELKKAASRGTGGVFDVGPYIGGSTAAMASGHRGKRKHVVIEAGGAYPDQPFLPSLDIIADLKRNLDRFGLLQHVSIYQGWSNDPAIYEPALKEASPIGLFFFDANGAVAEQLSICAPYMEDGCTVILDDINADQAKAAYVLPQLNRLMAKGALIQDKIIFGTWFGRIGKVDRKVFAHYPHDSGHAWVMRAPDRAKWRVELFEDGKPLEPGEAVHVDIRERGMGAWSHWQFETLSQVLFSTSDNSDPNENGRKYELRVTPR
jgi:predicted O-methyltransferase YrrM